MSVFFLLGFHISLLTLFLSTAYTTLGVAGRKRRLSAARRNAWAGREGGGGGCCTKIVSL